MDLRDLMEWLNERRGAILRGTAVLLLLALVGGGAYWWAVVRWKPPPSIFDSPVDDVLGYLAMDDFNELPLEERMRFLRELSDRFRGMEAAESAAMAGFMAGVTGPVREQMTQNARVLARDILWQGADGYFSTPPGDRDAYIDRWVVEWSKMGERLATGKERDVSDRERVDRIRRESSRGEERMKDVEIPKLSEDGALGFMSIWTREVEVTATPKQQGQISRFLQDVRKRYSDAF
jgi:hypothetical protein